MTSKLSVDGRKQGIARNLGQYGRDGSHVTGKMALKQYKKMYGKRFFFQTSSLRMRYSCAA